MRRRSFLSVTAIGVLGTAGCLDNLGDDEDEQENTTGLNTDPRLNQNDDESGDNQAEREEISNLYQSADRSYTSGYLYYIDAVQQYNSGEFTLAQVELIWAKSDLGSAEEDFFEALEIANDIDHAAAISILEDAEEIAGTLHQAAELLDKAAEAAQEGNLLVADDKSGEATDLTDDVDPFGIEDQEVIDSALNLD